MNKCIRLLKEVNKIFPPKNEKNNCLILHEGEDVPVLYFWFKDGPWSLKFEDVSEFSDIDKIINHLSIIKEKNE